MRGVDLVSLWRERRWRHLLTLIDGLPQNSQFSEALSLDDDVAEVLAAQPPGPYNPRMRDLSPEVAALYAVYDRLGALISVTATAGQLKGVPPLDPHPRPVTALEGARERHRRAVHERLRAQLLPDRR